MLYFDVIFCFYRAFHFYQLIQTILLIQKSISSLKIWKNLFDNYDMHCFDAFSGSVEFLFLRNQSHWLIDFVELLQRGNWTVLALLSTLNSFHLVASTPTVARCCECFCQLAQWLPSSNACEFLWASVFVIRQSKITPAVIPFWGKQNESIKLPLDPNLLIWVCLDHVLIFSGHHYFSKVICVYPSAAWFGEHKQCLRIFFATIFVNDILLKSYSL